MAASVDAVVGEDVNEEQNHNLENSEPFKATQLWYNIISYLKSHANLKRRRFMIRQYDNCFTGENAVNVVYHCLLEERKSSSIITGEITRTNAVKVCQALMDNTVFEGVGSKARRSCFLNSAMFEDSNCKLYRFVTTSKSHEVCTVKNTDNTSHSTSLEEEELKNCGVVNGSSTEMDDERIKRPLQDDWIPECAADVLSRTSRWSVCVSPFRRLPSHGGAKSDSVSLPSLFGGYSPIGYNEVKDDATVDQQLPSSVPTRRRKAGNVYRIRSGTRFAQVLKPFTSDLKKSDSLDQGVKLESPAKNWSGKPSLLSITKLLSSSSTNLLNAEGTSLTLDDDAVWKQVALSRLLTLIDLSFVDEVLPSPNKKLQRPSSAAFTIANHRLLSKLESGVNRNNENLWVKAAQEITDSRCFLLDNPIHLTETAQKQQAFEMVWRYYWNLPSAIVPVSLNKVFVAILGLVKEGRFSVAVHALQLFVLLLPWQQKKELEQLTGFMKMAAEDLSIRLKRQLTNRQFLLQQFTPVIVQYDLLAQDQAAILISFVLHNRHLVFQVPDDAKQEVENILMEHRLGTDTIPRMVINFCDQVPTVSYEETKKATSKGAMRELMNYVMDSVHMSLKDKEKWLKRFKKCHPELYEKWYHGDL